MNKRKFYKCEFCGRMVFKSYFGGEVTVFELDAHENKYIQSHDCEFEDEE